MQKIALAFSLMLTTTLAVAHDAKVGDLRITDLWTRATPGGAKVAGGYLTITNAGARPDKLISVVSPVSGKAEIHEMSMANGVMTMRPADAGVFIDAGKTVMLAPGGFHLMLMDLKQPLKEGETLPVTLQFEKAGKVETFLHVRSIGAQGPSASAPHGTKH